MIPVRAPRCLAGGRLFAAAILLLGLACQARTPPPRDTPDTPAPLAPPAAAIQAPPAPRQVRVCLAGPGDAVLLQIDGAYELRAEDTGKVMDQGRRLAASPVVRLDPGRVQIGKRTLPASRLDVVPVGSAKVWINGHTYRGRIELRLRSPGIVVINTVPLEDYVASVVDSEMPAEFGAAAREAQAIVARTFAVHHVATASAAAAFDLYGSTRSQKYLGHQYRAADGRLLAGETPAGRQAAERTAGMVCTHQGRVFCTYYSAVCGGRTMLGQEFFSDASPTLRGVRCEGCAPAKLYRWKVSLQRSDVDAKLHAWFSRRHIEFSRMRRIAADKPAVPGRLQRYLVSDGTGTHRLTADEVRTALGTGTIPSPRFEIALASERVVFEGRGSGHGVGLCQWGARGLGRRGKTAREIIAHYYPGARIVTLPAGAAKVAQKPLAK